MANFFHGVTTSLVNLGGRTISVPSSSVIGIVDIYTPGVGLAEPNTPVMVVSDREAVAAFGPNSPLTKACLQILDQAKAVIIAVGVTSAGTPASITSAVIGGVAADGKRSGLQALLDAKSLFNQHPRLLLAPKHSATKAVATAMDTLADKLEALGLIDGPGTTDEAAIAYATGFGSKRLYMVDPGVKKWSVTSNGDEDLAASPVAAGLFAQTDANIGFWASPSNKEIKNITGTVRAVEYLDNDPTCRANLLNNANITTIIRDGGYRLWGNRTLSSDSKWAFVTRVRTVDMVMAAVRAGMKWAVDLGITKSYVKDVTETVQAFMRDLKAAGAVIDFEVYADAERNTASQLAQGKIIWVIRFTDVPPAENPIFEIEVTDEYLTQVLDVA
ncbi:MULTISPECIES: phage tail sheath subtilisin-like domain-containing protein [Pseudomonas]|uniref:phage tail sheath subtilisin-like domain-containing protein n=1 Tax=Pseudomonas TaxID=286 RepID=UPI001EF84C56|nr:MULTISPECIES: phage tail sheath family protein [Pseudomonas]MDD2145873.1 phage tail sheath family protein [Pseudomonas putida]ULL06133.1 phage tail sheath family protein [Pseudomonas putida]WEL53789.1 phage tail sheath family protein [Pseudomonas kermanshahensis]HDS1705446.1 phage tail sheath family protein [Pseudomonas putida]